MMPFVLPTGVLPVKKTQREKNFDNFLSAKEFVKNYQYIHIDNYMVNSCNFKFTQNRFQLSKRNGEKEKKFL